MTLNKYLLACVCTFVFLAPRGAAADVTLMWDSNTETDLAGYQIGYGLAPGAYSDIVEVGNTTSYRFTNLQPDRTYYFAVRAYNIGGFSSPFSLEVSATIPPAAVPLQVTNIFTNSASPAALGSWVIFSTAATGGTAPYQYKWLISSGSTQTVARDWAAGSTFSWAPSRVGVYTITVWARSATSTADAPDNTAAALSTPFEITRKKTHAVAPSVLKIGP